MAGIGGAGLAGESGGEETVGGDAGRKTAGAAPAAGSDVPAAGFIARGSVSFPPRLPNTTAPPAGGLLCPKLLNQGRQERNPPLFGLTGAPQPLRDVHTQL